MTGRGMQRDWVATSGKHPQTTGIPVSHAAAAHRRAVIKQLDRIGTGRRPVTLTDPLFGEQLDLFGVPDADSQRAPDEVA